MWVPACNRDDPQALTSYQGRGMVVYNIEKKLKNLMSQTKTVVNLMTKCWATVLGGCSLLNYRLRRLKWRVNDQSSHYVDFKWT